MHISTFVRNSMLLQVDFLIKFANENVDIDFYG